LLQLLGKEIQLFKRKKTKTHPLKEKDGKNCYEKEKLPLT